MQVLNLVFGIFLARLLTPGDYGVVGMIAIFTAIAGNLQDSGFTQALINSRADERRDCSAVFWFNICVSLAIYVLLWALAPLIAAYFHQPCLVWLGRFIFLSFVFSALGIVPGALLSRRLMFRERTLCTFIALIGSGAAGITLAFLGYGYWSLAWQQLVYVALTTLSRYYWNRRAIHWRLMPRPGWEPIRRMLPFGWKVALTSVLSSCNRYLLTVLLGGRFTSRTVGLYTQAEKWTSMGANILTLPLGQVAQPVFVEAGDERERQTRVFRKMLRFTAFISFPALLGLALVADEFIFITIGPQWTDAVPLLRVLCIGSAFMPLYMVYQQQALSRGRSDTFLWLNAAQIVLQLAAFLYVSRWGVGAMVCAYSCITPLFLFVWQGACRRQTGIGWGHFLLDWVPFAFISLAAMVLTWLATQWTDSRVVLLAVRIPLAAALYLLMLRLLGARILDECLQYIRGGGAANSECRMQNSE